LSQDYTPLDVRPLNRIRQGLSILFFITLAVNIFEVARYFKKTSKEDRIARTEIELAMLKTQINPHFLFNSLNSIYYEAIEKSDIVPKAIMSLSNLMRYVLTEAESKYVTLQQEMNYIKGYIELQQLRLPEKTELEFTYLIDNDQNKIAPLLLIPFIENAFKYGISSSSETNIVIDLKVDNNRLIMLVENRVFTVNTSDGTNLGLENVNKRLELIYPQKYQLEILNNVETYKVQLSIDLG